MSGSVGHTFMYNLIILFIVIVFGFLGGTLSYYKAFKINNRIITALEKFEGYNVLAHDEIERILTGFGYSSEEPNCPSEYRNMYLVKIGGSEPGHNYCIYADRVGTPREGEFFQYGVVSYISIDLPFIRRLNIPIFTKTPRIYSFNGTKPVYSDSY